jgi:Vam6/Vps39-like protein vacuolar protein sorting-associated protein 39
LIARHGPRLNPEETLQLLPPLVSARDLRVFLTGALRIPRFDIRVVRGVAEARRDQVARKLMYLEANRVKIMDSRMYAFRTVRPYSGHDHAYAML